MFGLSAIGPSLRIAGLLALSIAIVGALLYLSHLRGQIADLTAANHNLEASVAVANTAAAVSAASAEHIAQLDQAAQISVAAEHATVTAANLQIGKIEEEFHLAPHPGIVCAANGGLPVAYLHALDELFDAPAGAGGSAGDPHDHAQAAARADATMPALAGAATAP